MTAICSLMSLMSYAQTVVVSGQVTDEAKSNVDFALIYLEELKVYTHTNEQGAFELKIPEALITEAAYTLIVQHISYKRQFIKINPRSSSSLNILLEPAITTLPGVTVSGTQRTKKIKADELVKTAVARIAQNYSDVPFLSTGYFSKRNIFKNHKQQKDYLLSLREAIVHQLNPGIFQKVEKQKIHVEHVRATEDYRTLYEPFSEIDTISGFIPTAEGEDLIDFERNYMNPERFFKTNPVETKGDYRELDKYKWKIAHDWYGKLNFAFVANHKFKLDEIVYDSYGQDSIYVIKVLPSSKSLKMLGRQSYAIPLGRLYIKTLDYAIVRYEYGIFDNPKKIKGRTFSVLRGSGQLNFRYKIVAEYLKSDGKYFLSYLRKESIDLSNQIVSANSAFSKPNQSYAAALVTNKTGAMSLMVVEEFSANSFAFGSEVNDAWNKLRFSEDFHSTKVNYNTSLDFWSQFSYPPESPENRTLREDLEKRIEWVKTLQKGSK